VRRTIDDAEAVALSLGGDLDAYAVLVARYTLRAHRAAFLLGAGEEASDVVQEAFVKAFRHLARFRLGDPFGPWLLSIVANETKNLTRSRRRRAALAMRVSTAGPAEGAADGPVDRVLAAERRAVLLAAVNVLPDRERQAVVCRYFLDLSEAETARVLGWPLGSVKSRTFRALNRLRGLLVTGQQKRVSSG
jgi:RNA polymerase sigma-70 factor (ECF subfamily)